MVLSLMGFALTHYGEYAKIVSKSNQNFWWYFYASMTIYYSIYYIFSMFDVHKWMKSLQRSPDTTNLKSAVKKHFGKISECLLTIADLCVSVAVLIFPYLVLFTNFSEEVTIFRFWIFKHLIADSLVLNHHYKPSPDQT